MFADDTNLFFEHTDLKLTNHGILHYLWPVDPSKSFSKLIVLIFNISQYFFIVFVYIYLFSIFSSIGFPRWKSVGLPRIAYIVIH